jgi:anti-sigma B factor antagonist
VLFALDVTKQQGWAILAVTGELELATAPQLRQRVVGLVGDGDTRIILDLAGVDFVDSVGLGVVVAALKRVRSRGGDVVVAGAAPRVREVFEITRLDEIVALFPDVDDALAALGPSVGPRDG